MTTPLRSLLVPALRTAQLAGPSRTCTASFASSSRLRLDCTVPRPAEQRTTVLDSSPSETSSSSSSSFPPSSSSTPFASGSSARPTTPQFDFSSPTPGVSAESSNNPSLSALFPPSAQYSSERIDKPKEGNKKRREPRYQPIEPLTVFRADPHNPAVGGKWYDVANRRSKTTHILHVKVTRNNVHLSFADARGNLFGTITAGTDKVFKKSNRSTYEAAFQAACKMFAKILDYARGDAERPGHVVQLCVAFNGLQGTGREAIAQAMQGPEGAEFVRLVTRVEDRTPIKMGGPRPRGQRNV